MSQKNPTDEEVDIYAKEYIRNGDQTKSFRVTFPNSKAAPETTHARASEFNKLSKVKVRIEELKEISTKIAEEKFTITVEQRLRWLKEIITSGLGDYVDAQENKRKENLAAAKSAIDTLNNMLGTDEDSGKVKPVKVMIGVKDASRP